MLHPATHVNTGTTHTRLMWRTRPLAGAFVSDVNFRVTSCFTVIDHHNVPSQARIWLLGTHTLIQPPNLRL